MHPRRVSHDEFRDRLWAQKHYQPLLAIDPMWPPMVRAECEAMNAAVDIPHFQLYRWIDKLTGERRMWNVARMRIDAQAGHFGTAITLPLASFPGPPHYENLDRHVIDAIKADSARLASPVIMIQDAEPAAENPEALHILCCVDGNHRVVARLEMKLPTFDCNIIPASVEPLYRIVGKTRAIIDLAHPDEWDTLKIA